MSADNTSASHHSTHTVAGPVADPDKEDRVSGGRLRPIFYRSATELVEEDWTLSLTDQP